MNIAKHLVFLTEKSFPHETSQTSANEISAAEQLFEVLKSFKDGYFSELDLYETLDFPDEYDEISEEENSADEENLDKSEDDDDESDDENQHRNMINNQFTLEEMENIIEWVNQHPNYNFTTIKHRFRKVKFPKYITRFREYIKRSGTGLEKLQEVKQFMWDEFYVKRVIEKEAVYDTDLQCFAIQKAREMNWEEFKASETFVLAFKEEYQISSRRYNKLITRVSTNGKVCRLAGSQNLKKWWTRFDVK